MNRPAAVAEYTLRLGDDALVLSQRLTEWVTRAPQLEEDMALANLALDLLGQARALLAYAGSLGLDGGAPRSEDELAYLRDEREFRNVQLVELENGDFAVTMARLLVFSAQRFALYRALTGSSDPTLAGVAGKAVKEIAYHRDHARLWVLRLGDGTAESHQRMQAGLERIRPYTDELFETDPLEQELVAAGIAVDSSTLAEPVRRFVDAVIEQATLTVPDPPGYRATGGRRGIHTEALGHLLPQMQYLARSHPGANW